MKGLIACPYTPNSVFTHRTEWYRNTSTQKLKIMMHLPGYQHRRITTLFHTRKSEYKIYLRNTINLLRQSMIFSTTEKKKQERKRRRNKIGRREVEGKREEERGKVGSGREERGRSAGVREGQGQRGGNSASSGRSVSQVWGKHLTFCGALGRPVSYTL